MYELTHTFKLIDFDKAFKQKGDLRLNEMWATVSALGLWMNVEDVSELISELPS